MGLRSFMWAWVTYRSICGGGAGGRGGGANGAELYKGLLPVELSETCIGAAHRA